MKRMALVLLVLLFASGLCAGELAVLEPSAGSATAPAAEAAGPVPAPAAVKDGYALLDSLLTLFENIVGEKREKTSASERKISVGLTEIDNRLIQLSMDSQAALEAGLVDRIFYKRYSRMLTIYKMIITPVMRGELLKDLFMKAFEDFVWDVTYERWRWEDKDSSAKMAAAMEEEFVQMMTYLDTRQKREELKKKIGKRMLPPPPPPPAKKKLEDKKPE
jgi:hypothetical protein